MKQFSKLSLGGATIGARIAGKKLKIWENGWATCIAREVFSLVTMGNVTHILPVLQWLEVVIAFDYGRICPKGSSADISFTHGPILWFFAPQGRHFAPIKVKFGREER